MNKLFRLMVVVIALVAFRIGDNGSGCGVLCRQGRCRQDTHRGGQEGLADAKLIVKGPFKTKAEAAAAVKGAKAAPSAKKAIKPPDEGC